MSEVKVRFRAVLCDINLTVLIRAHRAGVNVDIRVKLLRGNLESSRLEQSAERCRRNAFAETGHNASGHEYVFGHTFPPLTVH